jgi:hypothetical protein
MTRRPSLERAIRLGVLGAVLAACGGTTVTEVRSDGPSPAIVGDVPADIDPVITAAPSTTRALVPMLQEAALGDGWSATVIGTRAYTSEQQIARFPDSPAIAETDRYKFVFVKYRYSGVEPVASLSDVVSGIVDDQLGNIGTSCGIQGIEANQLPTSTELVHQVCAVVSNDRLSSAQFAARVGTNRVVIFDERGRAVRSHGCRCSSLAAKYHCPTGSSPSHRSQCVRRQERCAIHRSTRCVVQRSASEDVHGW